MSNMPTPIATAGKITIVTALAGLVVFCFAFLLNLGATELQQALAQGVATTTITVLNTPPQWSVEAREEEESSTANPTNSGAQVTWIATATDSNSAPYFLLVCSTAATPTAHPAPDQFSLGTVPPTCAATSTQWAVSTGTVSNTQARAATTTLEAWSEQNDWFAWICDDDPVNPRCNSGYRQGTSTPTFAAPFFVNHRPAFSAFTDDSPKLPGELVTFTTTASDSDSNGGSDTVKLFVCSQPSSFTASTSACTGSTLASSTFMATNPTSSYSIVIPTRDQNYAAYGYVVDNHYHGATGATQGSDSVLAVSNAAPYVNAGDITLNNGSDMILTNEAGETTGFTLNFLASDNNSCVNTTNTPGSEFSDYVTSVYRDTVNSTSTCDAAGEYDPNDCYTDTLATSTWNMSCTASTTSCTGATDLTMQYDCTFPLWYVADPTWGGATSTPYDGTHWRAAATLTDDDAATGILTQSSGYVDVYPLLAFALDVLAIPYGALEPGQQTDPLVASTTVRATGNVGVDELLTGESMCTTYTSSSTCPNSASSTIGDYNQVFATSSVTYAGAQGAGNILSSTTQNELEINVAKPTATSTQPSGATYWGIAVPISITLAGSYTGENTFYVKTSETTEW